jgi:hypothetical protein
MVILIRVYIFEGVDVGLTGESLVRSRMPAVMAWLGSKRSMHAEGK